MDVPAAPPASLAAVACALSRITASGVRGLPARFAVEAVRRHAEAEALLADHAGALGEAVAAEAARGNLFLPRHRFCLEVTGRRASE